MRAADKPRYGPGLDYYMKQLRWDAHGSDIMMSMRLRHPPEYTGNYTRSMSVTLMRFVIPPLHTFGERLWGDIEAFRDVGLRGFLGDLEVPAP